MNKHLFGFAALCLANLLIAFSAFFGCESAPGTGNGIVVDNYFLKGALVIDPNHDSTLVTAVGLKNNHVQSSVEIIVKNDTLAYEDTLFVTDSSWYFETDTARHYLPGAIAIKFNDGAFSRSFTQSVPDTFSITNVSPPNHLIQGNDPASIEWSGKAGYTAFAVAVIKADSAYKGKGWTSYSQTFITAATITPDAFLGSDGLNPDTGLYNLYVFGFVGSPDSTLASAILPVGLPNQLGNNIDQQRFSGRFGVVCVSLMDTIRVVQQP